MGWLSIRRKYESLCRVCLLESWKYFTRRWGLEIRSFSCTAGIPEAFLRSPAKCSICPRCSYRTLGATQIEFHERIRAICSSYFFVIGAAAMNKSGLRLLFASLLLKNAPTPEIRDGNRSYWRKTGDLAPIRAASSFYFPIPTFLRRLSLHAPFGSPYMITSCLLQPSTKMARPSKT